jgi:diguanylate cyclase (GGDEF)-like protein
MKTASPDLVLLDVNMPGMGGIETLKRIRANQSQAEETHTSVIIVSARSDTDDIVRGLDTGADDYVCKPFDPWELLARVRAQLRIKDLTDRLAEANERLQELVDIDDLTGLYNMRSVYQKLDLEIGRAKRYNRAVAVIMMDMDEFKDVNDSHDHLFGSFVLSEVGKIIRGNIRNVDFAARYGGDEFLIALSETTVEGAALFAERLRKVIGAYLFSKDGYSMHLTASIGVAVVQPTLQAVDAKTLVRYADHAMYDAKHSGKNCVKTFDMSSLSLRKTS